MVTLERCKETAMTCDSSQMSKHGQYIVIANTGTGLGRSISTYIKMPCLVSRTMFDASAYSSVEFCKFIDLLIQNTACFCIRHQSAICHFSNGLRNKGYLNATKAIVSLEHSYYNYLIMMTA